MQLFLFLNDLAGRWPWLDELFRILYIGTVPLLATLLLARLTLIPKAPHDPSRSRVVLAMVLAVSLCVLTMLAINDLATLLHLGVLSPRPFMTRRINLLIVEPQDNSFPSPELMVAAAFAVALAGLGKRWAITGAVFTLLLAIARLYCGNNYLVDVVAGTLIGAAWGGITLSLAQAPLGHLARRMQLSWSSALLGATLLGIYLGLTLQPRFATKLYAPWTQTATAAPTSAETNPKAPKATRDAQNALQEGEGMSEGEDAEHQAEVLALSKRSTLFLPAVEAFLRGRLAPRTRPFTLLDVEVAPVKAGSSSYRCAAVRFEIHQGSPDLRRQVAECAARLIKMCFLLDSQMQNVDVVAILRGDGKTIDNSEVTFVGDEVPVFTASVQRKNLYLRSPAWANLQALDGGSWLRLRSRLFVNEKVLPETPGHSGEPVPQPQGTFLPSAMATVTAPQTPSALPTTLPVVPLHPTTRPSPTYSSPTPRPSPNATPTATPTPRSSPSPTASPTASHTASHTPTHTPRPTAIARPTIRPTLAATPTPTPSASASAIPTTVPTRARPAPRRWPVYRSQSGPRYRRARKPLYRKPLRSKRTRRRTR